MSTGFRLNDITRATNAKSEVEQKQREEAKDRKLANGEWETKVRVMIFIEKDCLIVRSIMFCVFIVL